MAVTTPAVPASTVAQPNQTGQYIDVAVTGGTVSNITVTDQFGNSATAAGSSPANVAVPPGGSVTMTYTVAPSWTWTDPLQEGFTPTYSAENLTLINQTGQLPWPAHAEGGEAGLGEAVSN